MTDDMKKTLGRKGLSGLLNRKEPEPTVQRGRGLYSEDGIYLGNAGDDWEDGGATDSVGFRRRSGAVERARAKAQSSGGGRHPWSAAYGAGAASSSYSFPYGYRVMFHQGIDSRVAVVSDEDLARLYGDIADTLGRAFTNRGMRLSSGGSLGCEDAVVDLVASYATVDGGDGTQLPVISVSEWEDYKLEYEE